jgi:septum formation protein
MMTMWSDKLKKYDIVLASGSPRRQQLLAEMDIPFRVMTKPVEEVFPKNLLPEEAAAYLCRLKNDTFSDAELQENTLLITADTVVALNGTILGKPDGEKEAESMLRRLSAKKHEVITGVCLRLQGKVRVFTATTTVWFKSLSDNEIRYYVDQYRPFDKAGAYGIQEWIGHAAIEKIEGSYFNVMGLPTHRLYLEMQRFLP